MELEEEEEEVGGWGMSALNVVSPTRGADATFYFL